MTDTSRRTRSIWTLISSISGFVLKDKVTIIAAVSDPIDIFVTPTPPPDMDDFEWSLVWWLAGTGGVLILGAIFGAKLEKIFN